MWAWEEQSASILRQISNRITVFIEDSPAPVYDPSAAERAQSWPPLWEVITCWMLNSPLHHADYAASCYFTPQLDGRRRRTVFTGSDTTACTGLCSVQYRESTCSANGAAGFSLPVLTAAHWTIHTHGIILMYSQWAMEAAVKGFFIIIIIIIYCKTKVDLFINQCVQEFTLINQDK